MQTPTVLSSAKPASTPAASPTLDLLTLVLRAILGAAAWAPLLFMLVGKHKANGVYDFVAIGHGGQRIYVSPRANAIVVRHGISDEGVDHWEDVLASVVEKIR